MKRLRELRDQNIDFATESTLSARAYIPFIKDCQERGYRFNLIYIWLPHEDLAVERVAARVRSDGHDIPEATIRRRYKAGQHNFFELYQPLANEWKVFDNSNSSFELIARGSKETSGSVLKPDVWRQIYDF